MGKNNNSFGNRISRNHLLNTSVYGSYKYNDSSGCIDVIGNVDLSSFDLTKIPIKFGKVVGNFDCSNNRLDTLENSPDVVEGIFNCYNNNLVTLEGGA